MNERIMKLNLTLCIRDVTVLAVYGPIDDSSATEKDNFRNKLQSEITKLNKNMKL